MADVTAYMGVDPAISDVRREQAVGFGETKYAVSTNSESTNRDILTTGYHTQVKVDEAADKILQRSSDYFIAEQTRDFDAARDIAALKAATDLASQKLSTEILLSTERAAAAAALESARLGTAVALGQSNLSKDIFVDGEKTRALINDLKNADLNRQLIERNSDINYYRHDADRWEGLYGNGQFASLASQINALNSNLAETRQGLYNFGTMAGVGQSSTSNQVGG